MSRSILITGASSGIGRQLALEFAARGYRLALAARRVDSLVALKQEILAAQPQAQVELRALDVQQTGSVAAVIEELATTLGGLDIVVANAGIGDSGGNIGSGGFARDAAIIQTNVLGAMATIDAAVALFRRQQQGQIVAISSVAAARGLPGAGSYSASKAAIAVYADSARNELHGTAIRVTTLYPGFIDTAINQRLRSRPFVIPVEKGGRIIADLIERRVQQAAVPGWPWSLVMPLMKLLPATLVAKQNPLK
ncbi:MAG: SDR family oxidoreductase [Stagnimonas sp.]|nr:SDR family oxidoreductase [Stagnimonas sp.]